MPIQCPKPTAKPVVKNVKYKASIDDIENKLHGSFVRYSDRRFPNSFSAGTSHNNAGSDIDALSVGFKKHPVGAHFHARHSKIDKRFRFSLFSGQGYGELNICHGFNRFGTDIKDYIHALKLLRTGAMMDIAIYHLGMIRCCCCNRKDITINNEKKNDDP